MVGFLDAGAEVFDYGNSLRTEARLGGFDRAFDYPGFLPAYIRPLFCEGKGPFRWVALSGDPADIAATDRAVLEEFPDDEGLARWIRLAGERVAFQGLPARICWLGYGERHRLGLRFNELVALGPGRRRRSSSAATTSTPARWRRPTGRPRRWPTAPTPSPTGRCSTRWSTRRRARRGSASTTAAAWASGARSTPAWSCLADGTDLAAEKLSRVLVTDPGMGVIRHADAGYERAVEVADERGVRMPMREGDRR